MKKKLFLSILFTFIFTQLGFSNDDELLIPFSYNKKYGFVNQKLQVVIDPKYDYVSEFSNKGYAIVEMDNFRYYQIINKNNTFELPFEVSSINYITEDLYSLIKANENTYFIWSIEDNKVFLDNLGETSYSGTDPYILLRKLNSKDGKTYIDLQGNIIPTKYYLINYCYPFYEGRAVITGRTKTKDEIVTTVIDTNGKDITKYNLYRSGKRYSEGLLPVQLSNKQTGYLNLQGEFAFKIPFVCEDLPCATNFINGVAAIKTKSNNWSIINNKGEVVCKNLLYEEVRDFECGLSVVSKWTNNNKKYPLCGVINSKGELIIPCVLEKCSDFSNGYARIHYQGNDGLIDTEGNVYWSLNLMFGNTKGEKFVDYIATNP